MVFSVRNLPLELLHFGGFLGAAAVLSAIIVVATAALFFDRVTRADWPSKKKPLRTNGPARISMDQGMQLLLPPFSKARRRNTVDLGKNTPLFSFATYDTLFRGGRNCSKCARRRSRGRPHAVSLIGQLPFRLRQYPPPPLFSSIDVFSPRRFDP